MSSQNDTPASESVDGGLFRRVCGRFATGVTVVTTSDPDGHPHGLTVNSFCSVSLQPPLVLVSLDSKNSSLAWLLEGSPFAVNILSVSGEALSRRFSASVEDRFGGVEWTGGLTGAPVLSNTLGYFECVLEKSVEAGDHTILIAAVKNLRLADLESGQSEPLVYFDSSYRTLL